MLDVLRNGTTHIKAYASANGCDETLSVDKRFNVDVPEWRPDVTFPISTGWYENTDTRSLPVEKFGDFLVALTSLKGFTRKPWQPFWHLFIACETSPALLGTVSCEVLSHHFKEYEEDARDHQSRYKDFFWTYRMLGDIFDFSENNGFVQLQFPIEI